MPVHPYAASLLLAGLVMAGCSSNQFVPSASNEPAVRGCDAGSVKHLVGKTASPDVLEQARSQAGAETARILRPNDVVTLEYNSQRLNLGTDDALVIQRINCG